MKSVTLVVRLLVVMAVVFSGSTHALAEDCSPEWCPQECAQAGPNYVVSAYDCWTYDCGYQDDYDGWCYWCCDVETGNCV